MSHGFRRWSSACAYRRQHPDTLLAFETPEAALAALNSSDDGAIVSTDA
jgi:hypothetical protein